MGVVLSRFFPANLLSDPTLSLQRVRSIWIQAFRYWHLTIDCKRKGTQWIVNSRESKEKQLCNRSSVVSASCLFSRKQI